MNYKLFTTDEATDIINGYIDKVSALAAVFDKAEVQSLISKMLDSASLAESCCFAICQAIVKDNKIDEARAISGLANQMNLYMLCGLDVRKLTSKQSDEFMQLTTELQRVQRKIIECSCAELKLLEANPSNTGSTAELKLTKSTKVKLDNSDPWAIT